MSDADDPALWQRAEVVFHELIDLPVESREAAMRERCGDNHALRVAVESLLTAAAALSGEPDTQVGPAQALPTPEVDPLIGSAVGPFKILRCLGAGGMGRVYEAEQQQPRRRVALKVLARGLASRSTLRRFRSEIEVLGNLQHPGIAQLYEAGTFDEGEGGVPWFAMELIDEATSILRYAAAHKLDKRARLMLFTQVCDAVAHGHLKGIVHRDLKPGNILIDHSGSPRLIDFGIARATESDINVTTIGTHTGALLGTIAYMSPEQCRGDSREIDIRSDVYSLGVILYELLTGTKPYDLSHTSIIGASRIVQETAPIPMSRADRALRGDLETIVAAAMEKDPDRRYQSARECADDIRRLLAGEPIRARPPSTLYLARCFVQRHRAASVIAGAAASLLITASVVSTSLYVESESQRKRADEAAQAEADGRSRSQIVSAISPPQSIGKIRSAIGSLTEGSWEHYYASLAADESHRVLHPGMVHLGFAGSVSSDGTHALLWRRDLPIQVIDVETGDVHSHMSVVPLGGPRHVSSAVLGPADMGGNRLLVSTQRSPTRHAGDEQPTTLMLHLVDTEHRLTTLDQVNVPSNRSRSFLFSPAHHLVAVGTTAGELRVFSLANTWPPSVDQTRLRHLGTWPAHGWHVRGLAISPDGQRLASTSSDRTARLWSIPAMFRGEDDPLLATLIGHRYYVTHADFSPDGRLLATAGNDGTVRVWDVEGAIREAAEPPRTAIDRRAEYHAILEQRFGDVPRAAIAASLAVIPADRLGVAGVVFDNTGVLHSAGADRTLRSWRVRPVGDGLAALDVKSLGEQVGAGHEIRRLMRDDARKRLVTLDTTSEMHLWSPRDFSRLRLRGAGTGCRTTCVFPDSRHVAIGAGDGDARALVYDMDTATQVSNCWHGANQAVWALASWQSGDHMVLAAAVTCFADNTPDQIVLWDMSDPATPRLLESRSIVDSELGVRAVAVSPDGSTLIAGTGDGRIVHWALEQRVDGLPRLGETMWQHRLVPPTPGTPGENLDDFQTYRGVMDIAVIGDSGQWILAGTSAGLLKVVDLSAGSDATLMERDGAWTEVAVADSGRWAAAGADDGLVARFAIDDTSDRPAVMPLRSPGDSVANGHRHAVTGLAFLESLGPPRLVSTGRDLTIRLQEPSTGRWMFTLEGEIGQVWDLAVSPDGRRIVTATIGPWGRGNGGTVWEASTKDVRRQLAPGRIAATQGAELLRSIRYTPHNAPNAIAEALRAAWEKTQPPLPSDALAAALKQAHLLWSGWSVWEWAAAILTDPDASAADLEQALRWTSAATSFAQLRMEPHALHAAALARTGHFEEALAAAAYAATLGTGIPLSNESYRREFFLNAIAGATASAAMGRDSDAAAWHARATTVLDATDSPPTWMAAMADRAKTQATSRSEVASHGAHP